MKYEVRQSFSGHPKTVNMLKVHKTTIDNAPKPFVRRVKETDSDVVDDVF